MPSEITQSWMYVSIAGGQAIQGVERNFEKVAQAGYCTVAVLLRRGSAEESKIIAPLVYCVSNWRHLMLNLRQSAISAVDFAWSALASKDMSCTTAWCSKRPLNAGIDGGNY